MRPRNEQVLRCFTLNILTQTSRNTLETSCLIRSVKYPRVLCCFHLADHREGFKWKFSTIKCSKNKFWNCYSASLEQISSKVPQVIHCQNFCIQTFLFLMACGYPFCYWHPGAWMAHCPANVLELESIWSFCRKGMNELSNKSKLSTWRWTRRMNRLGQTSRTEPNKHHSSKEKEKEWHMLNNAWKKRNIHGWVRRAKTRKYNTEKEIKLGQEVANALPEHHCQRQKGGSAGVGESKQTESLKVIQQIVLLYFNEL